MNESLTQFLTSNRVASFTTILPDNTLHGAALHYSENLESFKLYFSTENSSRKCKGLMDGKERPAAVVIGFSEAEWVTMQLDGAVRLLTDPNEIAEAKKIHYTKHPEAKKYENDPGTVFLEFTPTWWRYTDYNTSPITIVHSEGK